MCVRDCVHTGLAVYSVCGRYRDAWKHCSSDIAFCLRLDLMQGVPAPAFNITAQRQTP